MQVAVVAHPPPAKAGAERREREPGGDVGLVIEVGDDDLVALAERLAHGQADQADEGGRIHAEGDLVRIARIDQGGDAGSCPCIVSSTATLCE